MKKDNELIIRNCLIVFTILSFVITSLNWTYQVYINNNIEEINNVLLFINKWPLWITNIAVYIFGILYIIKGIRSKKEVALKVAFSTFSIISTTIFMTFIVNFIAFIFNILYFYIFS